jgi:hypothetical protein
LITYRLRKSFRLNVGFTVGGAHVQEAAILTNNILGDLPASLYRCVDFKTISSIVGAIFCESLASKTSGIVNPIEKGHPDLVPPKAKNASEAELRNYPQGLEVKCTVGNIENGANLRAGQKRLSKLVGITWQAHHREVKELMGIAWDFTAERDAFSYPTIIGVFYSDALVVEDWGKISGTTGRNTKVTGMRASGKAKMGAGWVLLIDDRDYLIAMSRLLGFQVAGTLKPSDSNQSRSQVESRR